jgi:hypothetical protein
MWLRCRLPTAARTLAEVHEFVGSGTCYAPYSPRRHNQWAVRVHRAAAKIRRKAARY